MNMQILYTLAASTQSSKAVQTTQTSSGNLTTVLLICAIVLILFSFLIWICSRYKKCPSDKILVVIGKLPKDANGCPQTSKCVHGGAVFVVPLLQKHYYLDLNPLVLSLIHI